MKNLKDIMISGVLLLLMFLALGTLAAAFFAPIMVAMRWVFVH